MKALIVSGTARKDNNSIKVAQRLQGLSPVDTEIFDLSEEEVPMMRNRASQGEVPEPVQRFREKVVESDYIVLVSPEYNHGMPGALKNLLEYLYEEYNGKKFGFVTVSAGGLGGVRQIPFLHEVVHALGGRLGPHMPVSNVPGSLEEEAFESRAEDFWEQLSE